MADVQNGTGQNQQGQQGQQQGQQTAHGARDAGIPHNRTGKQFDDIAEEGGPERIEPWEEEGALAPFPKLRI